MPTLNSERFLREALNSIIDQSYKNIEMVVVDGGSTDKTLEILEEYNQGGGLKILGNARGLGMGHDLNVGLDSCTGTFIARMDADDIAKDWRIDVQYNYLCANTEFDLVGSWADLFGNRSGECRAPLSPDDVRNTYLVNNPFFHPTVMFHRRIVDSGVMRYDEMFQADEDYELWGRLISSIRCANQDCSTLRYRIHGSNGQRHPRQLFYKRIALERFCRAEGIYSPELVEALCEFQASAFVTPDNYRVLRTYGLEAEAESKSPPKHRSPRPKLGWIQHTIIGYPDYTAFIKWYNNIKGWKIGF